MLKVSIMKGLFSIWHLLFFDDKVTLPINTITTTINNMRPILEIKQSENPQKQVKP